MSRYSAIFNALFLSLLIVAIGGGVTLVHCNRMQQTTVAQLSMAAIDGDLGENIVQAPCCRANASEETDNCIAAHITSRSCMDYVQIRVSPQTYSPAPHFSFIAPSLALPAYMLWTECREATLCCEQAILADMPSHGPPRSYLRRLRLLQI